MNNGSGIDSQSDIRWHIKPQERQKLQDALRTANVSGLPESGTKDELRGNFPTFEHRVVAWLLGDPNANFTAIPWTTTEWSEYQKNHGISPTKIFELFGCPCLSPDKLSKRRDRVVKPRDGSGRPYFQTVGGPY